MACHRKVGTFVIFEGRKYSNEYFTANKNVGKRCRTILIMREEIIREAEQRALAENARAAETAALMEIEESQTALAGHVAS